MDVPDKQSSLEFIVFEHVSSASPDFIEFSGASGRNVWSEREIALLTQFILQNGENFKKASVYLKEQTGVYKSAYLCQQQYHNRQTNRKRGRWSTAELEKLMVYAHYNKTAYEIHEEFKPRTVEQIEQKIRQFYTGDMGDL